MVPQQTYTMSPKHIGLVVVVRMAQPVVIKPKKRYYLYFISTGIIIIFVIIIKVYERYGVDLAVRFI